jgi:hypothetical protein
MRKSIYVFLFSILLSTTSALADSGVRLGIKGGYSVSLQYGITPADMEYTVKTFLRHAGTGGLMIYYPINDSFGIQQEFLFVMKGSRQDIGIPEQSVTTHVEYDLNYLELPVIFRYKIFRRDEFLLYGTGGYALSVLLNGKARLDGSVNEGSSPIYFSYSSKIEGLDLFDYGLVYGLGAEFPLLDKDFFIDYRFTIGWNTLLMPTFPDEPPAPLRNQNYGFTVGMYL